MACARDDPFDTGIHSLETNNTRIDTPIRQLVYSTSLFSPVPKRLVTITCSIQTPGGIVAKKPQHAQNNQRSQQGKQGQQQKRGGKAQSGHTTHAPAAPVRPWRPGRDKFLPVSRADMDARGWDQCDFVYICGDAYVDHPSFGMAIVSRVLDAHGYKVGIICQPDWTDPASITVLGEPRLGFLVSAGNMDSMVNHYSVTKHRRHTDAYTPGGEEGHRPNRAVTVYGNLIRQTFKDAPIIIGGIEASLRRLAHYDYWQDKLKRSVLLDSGADILIYGMGEHAVVEIADALDAGLPVDQITYINGTVYRTGSLDEVYDYDLLPSWDDLTADKLNYARSFNVQQQNMDPITGHRLVEPYPNSVYVVQNPPSATLTTDEMDEVAELPYARDWHPDYDVAGGVPAFAEIKFSISSNRGCFGECSFCALTFHQGRVLQMRSHDSIMREAGSRAIPSLRATSTTWADRRQTLAALPATSSSSTACARTSAACGRACARTWWSTRAATRSCCATCASCRASRRSSSAAASALTTPWPTPRTSFCASCWSTISRASSAWHPST